MSSEIHARGMERTSLRPSAAMAEATSSARTQETTGPALKLLVRGLERDERQLLDGLVRVSLRRSPRLEILEEHDAGRADVVLIGAGDSTAVTWARQQPWIENKAVIWIGGRGPVPAGHTIIRRPVQWSILPILLARALENGPSAPSVVQAAAQDTAHSTFLGRFSRVGRDSCKHSQKWAQVPVAVDFFDSAGEQTSEKAGYKQARLWRLKSPLRPRLPRFPP